MAQHPQAAMNTRIHTTNAGANIHLELFKNTVDGAFRHMSLFEGLVPQGVTLPDTNTYRIDRMGASNVQARRVGDVPEPQKVANDKFVIEVDTALIIQNRFDFIDKWTSPDRLSHIGQDNGARIAKAWDEAHVIQLLKAAKWKAPAELKAQGAFWDGKDFTATIKARPASADDYRANADALVQTHSEAVVELINRDAPLTNLVTLVKPEVYSMLMYSKLLDKDFSTGNGDFAGRRIGMMNGLRIVECNSFPTQALVTTPHQLHSASNTGVNFQITADDLKYGMVIFDTSMSLQQVVAKDWETNVEDVSREQSTYMTLAGLRTVAGRRPDLTMPIKVVTA